MKTFIVRERVAFCETDASGIMHFASPLRYFEIGEREAMRSINVRAGDSRRGGMELPRVNLTCQYHQPLYYDDEIEIHSTCTCIRNSSMIWQHEIYRDGELCVSGQLTCVHVDKDTRRPVRIPDEWRIGLLGSGEIT
ncbi:acyl-CoA thioesterase [Alicyclobacillus herbarius]|uniref:acyl-CoA thioesterase n=1 Tax=Alicyclobacillus herbarius TaxID=122960 RepID=UPI00042608FE|nr:thioesterase family protein [Alicyclobacillus herbarius]